MTSLSLSSLLDVRGVQHAAVVSRGGEVLVSMGETQADATTVGAARAVLQSLQAATDSQGWNDLLLDLDEGPVLLTPMGDHILVVHFDEIPALGRVRLGVRRIVASHS